MATACQANAVLCRAFDNGVCFDMVILVGERKFKAHAAVLAAHSRVFRVLFNSLLGDVVQQSGRSASASLPMHHIALQSPDASTMERLLRVVYTGVVDVHMDSADGVQSCSDLLAAAKHYEMDAVYHAVRHHIIAHMTPVAAVEWVRRSLWPDQDDDDGVQLDIRNAAVRTIITEGIPDGIDVPHNVLAEAIECTTGPCKLQPLW